MAKKGAAQQQQRVRPSPSEIPPRVGDRVVCKAIHDCIEREGEVLEVESGSGVTRLYVHYPALDKRLDHWADASSVRRVNSIGSPRLLLSNGSGDYFTASEGPQKLTRRQKRKYEEVHHIQQSMDDLPPTYQEFEKQHQEKTKVKNIHEIQLGRYRVATWYYSPYPAPYRDSELLYICEYSLKYFRKRKTLYRHFMKLEERCPPGTEIYRSAPPPAESSGPPQPKVSVFEVDGAKAKVYCQNLCLLSKLFLDHKTLYYDVEPFLFYLICEWDDEGHHLVGYFSKEKHSMEEYNLACILCLPPFQKRGYGKFMIQVSYELSRREGKKGTPERPLSDLGQVSYRSYWTRVLVTTLFSHKGNITLQELSELTSIRVDDIVWTLQPLELVRYRRGEQVLSVTPRILEQHMESFSGQQYLELDASRVNWTPSIAPMSRSAKSAAVPKAPAK